MKTLFVQEWSYGNQGLCAECLVIKQAGGMTEKANAPEPDRRRNANITLFNIVRGEGNKINQVTLFNDYNNGPLYFKDSECTIDTPVIMGHPDQPIYGTGYRIIPRIPGNQATEYQKKIHLPNLLPLEDYDKIIILFSGGKDSTACFFKLLEMGVPIEKN
jgi:hypothetical protein